MAPVFAHHSDNEPFINPSSDIFTLSMGAERTMKFDSITKHTCKVDDSILLKDNDLLVFSRVSQGFNHHSIVSDESATGVRYSFTFRCLLFTLGIFHTSIVILSTVPVPCLMQSIKLLKKSMSSSPQKQK